MERVIVSQDDFLIARNHLMNTGTFFMAGHSTLSVPSQQRKYLSDKGLRMWPDANGELVLLTPGEAARCEMNRAFPNLKRVGWKGPSIKLFDKKPPMVFSGPIDETDMIYIDLKSAYWQIYQQLWLDVAYPRGIYGKYPLFGVALRLGGWKAARNAVIGICRSRELVGYRGHQRVKMQSRNKYLSPGLWATVQDILHWVAQTALKFGATYINTDGYLFDNMDGADSFMMWLADEEFIFEVRSRGAGEIRAWNNYRVGNKSTQPYKLGLPSYNKEFNNVQGQPNRKWSNYRTRLRYIVRSTAGCGQPERG